MARDNEIDTDKAPTYLREKQAQGPARSANGMFRGELGPSDTSKPAVSWPVLIFWLVVAGVGVLLPVMILVFVSLVTP